MAAAGIDPALARPPQRQEVLEFLRARHAQGAPLSGKAVRQPNRHLARAATRHFGSYVAALREAGIRMPHELRPRMTAEEVLAALRKKRDAGRDLSYDVMNLTDPELVRACRYRFESYIQALREIGLSVASRRRHTHWSKKRLTAELRRVEKRRPGSEAE